MAQNAKKIALQKEYNSLKNEIQELQNTINTRKKERNISLKEVEVINQKIDKRKTLIANVGEQLNTVEDEIKIKQNNLSGLNEEIGKVKAEYAKIILWMNKNHSQTNKLAFVLEASSFKDAYHRLRYIKKYGNFRAKQSIYIKNSINRIIFNINELNAIKIEKSQLLTVNQKQQEELQIEKKQRDQAVVSLSYELEELRNKISEKNKMVALVNSKIKRAIEDDIAKERKRMIAEVKEKKRKIREENSRKGITSTDATLSDEVTTAELKNTPEGILANNFLNSKGGLPWPVASGVVTSKFGRQPHPSAPEIMIDNVGIDIKTTENADVCSIFKGKVMQIFEMPPYHTCITIKHGTYFTVYSYLKKVTVKVGDEVNAKTVLGKSCYSEDHGYALTNLQIWNFQNKENPLSWIRK